MALEGLRILDFTRLGFGAQATLICGCLGADVIRVESTRFPDAIRVMPPFVPEPGERGEAFGAATLANATGAPSPNRGGIFYKYNTGGKRSITVDARHPKGLALLKDLVAQLRRRDRELRGGTLAALGPLLRGHAARSGPTSSTCRCAGSATRAPTPPTSPWARPPRRSPASPSWWACPTGRRRGGRSRTSTTWAATSGPSPSSPA